VEVANVVASLGDERVALEDAIELHGIWHEATREEPAKMTQEMEMERGVAVRMMAEDDGKGQGKVLLLEGEGTWCCLDHTRGVLIEEEHESML
jgi:hypothetical protein